MCAKKGIWAAACMHCFLLPVYGCGGTSCFLLPRFPCPGELFPWTESQSEPSSLKLFLSVHFIPELRNLRWLNTFRLCQPDTLERNTAKIPWLKTATTDSLCSLRSRAGDVETVALYSIYTLGAQNDPFSVSFSVGGPGLPTQTLEGWIWTIECFWRGLFVHILLPWTIRTEHYWF